MTATGTRTAAYVTGLTLAVGALGGLVAAMTVFVPLDRSTSLVEARLGATVVWVFAAVLVLLYVLGPPFVAAVQARTDGRWTSHGLVAAGPVLGLPVALLGIARLDRVRLETLPRAGGLVLLAAGVIGVVGAVLLGVRWLGRETAVGVPAVPTLLVLVCLLGLAGVMPVATGFADDHTESRHRAYAQIEAEGTTTPDGTRVVVFTHTGGDPLQASETRIVGQGFAESDDPAVDQTGPGPWQGEASGEYERLEGDFIRRGDSVTVAVEGDCTLTVVVERPRETTLQRHECGADGT